MTLSHTHIEHFDLNLLRVLDVLLRTRGVTRAAAELDMTQSGVSRALKRLREQFRDPLLMRDGRRMVLTAVAENLAPAVARILADSRLLFASGVGFDPKTASWRVPIASAGYAEHVFLPRLVARVRREAPGVDVHMSPGFHRNADDLADGRMDFVIDVTGALDGPDIVTSRLFDDSFCCVVRASHPVIEAGLTLRRFADLEHVLIAPRGAPGGHVDEVLAGLGLERRVRVIVSSFTAPLDLVAESDFIVTMPRRIATQLSKHRAVALLDPPLEASNFSMSVYWSARRRTEPAHVWFRGVLSETAASLRNDDAV